MKQILSILDQKELGEPVLPPFSEFTGVVAAKIKRNGTEEYILSKWNPLTKLPDVSYDQNAFKGNITQFICLYCHPSTGPEIPAQNESVEDLRTNKELDALLIAIGVDEKEVKKLPNKAARVKLLKELEEKGTVSE